MPVRPGSSSGRTVGRRGDNPDGEPSRWARSGTACAVGLVAVLIVSGGVIGWSRLRDDSRSPAARAAAGVPVTGAVPAAPTSGHRRRNVEPSSPTPTQVTWLQVGLGALPFSASAGPTTVRGGVPSGFARTRPGAVEAAIQILGRLSWSAQTTASMRAVATASTTPAAHAVASLTYDPPGDPSVIPAVAGFQIVTYSRAQALVNIALRFNGTLRVVPAMMQWTDAGAVAGGTGGGAGGAAGGDWKLAGAPGPLNRTSWAAVDDLTGYLLFSGAPTKAGN